VEGKKRQLKEMQVLLITKGTRLDLEILKTYAQLAKAQQLKPKISMQDAQGAIPI